MISKEFGAVSSPAPLWGNKFVEAFRLKAIQVNIIRSPVDHQGRHMGPEVELASLGAGLQAPLSKLPHSEGGGVTIA